MKLRTATVLATLILAATASLAQVTLPDTVSIPTPGLIQNSSHTNPWFDSFRNASTAYMLEDDLDLMLGLYGYLDPARINVIEGRRLYTNLSNFLTKTEEQFNPSDVNTYLVGGSGNVMGYGYAGLLYDRFSFRDASFMGHDHDGNDVNGVLEGDEVTLENTDGIDGYDTRVHTKFKLSDWTERGGADYFLAYARMFNDIKAGIAIKRTQYNEFDYDSLRNFENQAEGYNLNTGAQLFSYSEKDSGRKGFETSLNIVGLSAWKPLGDKMEASLRLAFGFGPYTRYNEQEYTGDSIFTSGDSYGRTWNDLLTDERSMSLISAGGAYVYKWSDIVNTRADVQFTTRSAKADGATQEYSFHEWASVANPTDSSYSYSDAITGEYSAMDLGLIVKNTVKWDRVDFAIGAGLMTGKWEDLVTRDRTSQATFSYRFNNDPLHANSYVNNWSWAEKWENNIEYGFHQIVFPVGLEFAITEPVHFRLGALHQIYYSDRTDNYVLISGDGRRTLVTTYGDGTVTGSVEPNPMTQNTGTSNTITEHSSDTYYTYGAGWKFSDNLQLDFMGFARLTDLTEWKLSAIIKF